VHQRGAEALAAELLGDEEELDEEPLVGGTAPKAADGAACVVFEEDAQQLEVGRWTVAQVVVDQKVVDGFATIRDVLIDDEACGFHGGRIALRG
jgi:hypothetical protein